MAFLSEGEERKKDITLKMLLNQKLVVKDLQNKTSCRRHLTTSDFFFGKQVSDDPISLSLSAKTSQLKI